jgi:large subunit ribosomal protein L25
MKTIELEVTSRGSMTKNELARYRKSGTIPAVLYGRHLTENIYLGLSERDFGKVYGTAGKIALYKFKSDSKDLNGRAAMVKDLQRDCISTKLLHVDMLEINMNEKIHVNVPIEFTGTPVGAKEGGVFEVQTRELTIECLPADMPEKLVVDISNLKVNEGLHVSDIKLPNNVKTLMEAGTALCSVHIVEEVVVETTPIPTEVEVVGGKGKAVEEGEEGAAVAADGKAAAAGAAKPAADGKAAPAAADAKAAKPAADAKAGKGDSKK